MFRAGLRGLGARPQGALPNPMLCCAAARHAICFVVVVHSVAMASSSALHLAHLAPARDERGSGNAP